MKTVEEQKQFSRSLYWAVISSVALTAGSKGMAQANTPRGTGSSTNAPPTSLGATNVTQLGNITVIGKLNEARNNILPNLGATAYTHTAEDIEMQSQGDNAPFNQVVLRSPGVAQDSAVNGDLHVRGEHANLQYRIDDVLLPEGITGFGLELDPRFVQSMQLITGSLPAQYGFRTAGVVDIQTKSGALENGGEVDLYGGSFDTIKPSFEYGGTKGTWDYFVDGSYDHNDLGIENPTASHAALHDETDQFKTFASASHIIDDTSRITFMGSASYSNFQVPNTPGLPAGTAPDGSTPWNVAGSDLPATFNSADLNEQQREQNYYGVAAYQKSMGDFNGQLSLFGRSSDVHFRPDVHAHILQNEVANRSESPDAADSEDRAMDNPQVNSLARFAASSGASLMGDLYGSSASPSGKSIARPKCLLAESARKGDGVGPVVPLDDHCCKLLVVTLGITDVVERTGLTVSVWGSADQSEWGSKPLLTFRQRQYCGVYSVLLNLAMHPDVRYLRVQWNMNRWGRGERTPLFGFEVFLEESGARVSGSAVA